MKKLSIKIKLLIKLSFTAALTTNFNIQTCTKAMESITSFENNFNNTAPKNEPSDNIIINVSENNTYSNNILKDYNPICNSPSINEKNLCIKGFTEENKTSTNSNKLDPLNCTLLCFQNDYYQDNKPISSNYENRIYPSKSNDIINDENFNNYETVINKWNKLEKIFDEKKTIENITNNATKISSKSNINEINYDNTTSEIKFNDNKNLEDLEDSVNKGIKILKDILEKNKNTKKDNLLNCTKHLIKNINNNFKLYGEYKNNSKDENTKQIIKNIKTKLQDQLKQIFLIKSQIENSDTKNDLELVSTTDIQTKLNQIADIFKEATEVINDILRFKNSSNETSYSLDEEDEKLCNLSEEIINEFYEKYSEFTKLKENYIKNTSSTDINLKLKIVFEYYYNNYKEEASESLNEFKKVRYNIYQSKKDLIQKQLSYIEGISNRIQYTIDIIEADIKEIEYLNKHITFENHLLEEFNKLKNDYSKNQNDYTNHLKENDILDIFNQLESEYSSENEYKIFCIYNQTIAKKFFEELFTSLNNIITTTEKRYNWFEKNLYELTQLSESIKNYKREIETNAIKKIENKLNNFKQNIKILEEAFNTKDLLKNNNIYIKNFYSNQLIDISQTINNIKNIENKNKQNIYAKLNTLKTDVNNITTDNILKLIEKTIPKSFTYPEEEFCNMCSEEQCSICSQEKYYNSIENSKQILFKETLEKISNLNSKFSEIINDLETCAIQNKNVEKNVENKDIKSKNIENKSEKDSKSSEIPEDIDKLVNFINNDNDKKIKKKKKKNKKVSHKDNKNYINLSDTTCQKNEDPLAIEVKNDLLKNSINRYKIHKIKPNFRNLNIFLDSIKKNDK